VTGSTRGEHDLHSVSGERTTALVDRARSVQSRLSSFLAAGLMITLGLAALTWYYAHALTRQSRSRQAAQSTAVTRAQGEMPLPSLGRIEPPLLPGAPAGNVEPAPATAPQLPPELPLEQARVRATSRNPDSGAPAAPANTHRQRALERRLAGTVFARESQSSATTAAAAVSGPDHRREDAEQAAGVADARRADQDREGALAALLSPGDTSAAQARVLPTERLLLPKGAFIDCTLETAIDSTLPGMTTCITAADTFGADGKVVLLERGTKLVGETRGQVRQGQARVFVLWTQARTPSGVVVPLDSPGTDELGRAGLPGEVQRHFWERFGAAMLISLVDGAVQAGVQASSRSGGGAVIYTPSGSQQVLTEVLKDTLHIGPTIVKHNGDRIQVLVARDVDFRSVYELRAPIAGR
jgi:type IV secretion system protein VirB10